MLTGVISCFLNIPLQSHSVKMRISIHSCQRHITWHLLWQFLQIIPNSEWIPIIGTCKKTESMAWKLLFIEIKPRQSGSLNVFLLPLQYSTKSNNALKKHLGQQLIRPRHNPTTTEAHLRLRIRRGRHHPGPNPTTHQPVMNRHDAFILLCQRRSSQRRRHLQGEATSGRPCRG